MPNVRRCAIIGCNSHSKRNPELSFFRFPHQDSPYYEQWRRACHASLSRILPFKMAYICTLHFDRSVVSGRRLSGLAVPSRFLDVPAMYKQAMRQPANAGTDTERRTTYINGVVYEWLLRASKNPELTGTITHGMIKEKAETAKQIIKCDAFVVDNRWLNNFRVTYLRDFSKKSAEAKTLGDSLNIPDIVNELKYRFPSVKSDPDVEDDDGDDVLDETDIMDADNDIDDTDADGDDMDNYNKESNDGKENSTPATPNAELNEQPANGVQLRSYQEALDYLKNLEDFVARKEDFRAINLVCQLESLLRKGDHIDELDLVD